MSTSSKLTIEIDGNEAKAHAAFMALSKDQKALVQDLGKMGAVAEATANKTIQAAKAETKQRQDQIRLAEALVKQNEGLTKAYDRQKAALDQALQAGTITAEQHKHTLDSLQQKVREGSVEFIKAKETEAEAQRKLEQAAKAELKVRDDQVAAGQKIVNSSQSIEQAYRQQKAALDAALAAGKITMAEHAQGLGHIRKEAIEANKKLGDMEDATEKGVGASSVSKVEAFATRFITIAAAVRVVQKALEFYNAEKEKATSSSDSLTEVRRSLRQVSQGDMDVLESRADGLTQFGIDRVAARQLVFDARSTGFEGEEATVAAADPVIGIKDGSAFAGEFRKFFQDENLSIEQAFNTALAAAAESQKNISGILPQIRTAAQGRLSGGESSDIAATVSVLVDKFGDSTGDRVRNLGIELANNEKTSGMNMIDAMRVVLDDPELRDEIQGGSKEVMSAVKGFEEFFDRIVATDKRIEQAQALRGEDSLIRKATAEALDNSELGKIEQARRSAIATEARNETVNEKARAQEAFKAKAAVSTVQADAIADGVNLGGRKGVTAAAKALSALGASPETIKAGAAFAGEVTSGLGLPGFAKAEARAGQARISFANDSETIEKAAREAGKIDELERLYRANDMNAEADRISQNRGVERSSDDQRLENQAKSMGRELWQNMQNSPNAQQTNEELRKQTSFLERIASGLGENQFQAV